MRYCTPTPCTLPSFSREDKTEKILSRGCQYFEISRDKLTGVYRGREIKDKRHMLITILKDNTDYSLKRVGEIFNRHYSTVINSKKTVSNLCFSDENFKSTYEDLIRYIFANKMNL